MSDYDRYQNNNGPQNEYQPVIDRLREIAARGFKTEGQSADPEQMKRYELAGSGGGQMMNKQALDSVRQLMSNPDMMNRVVDWMHQGGMMEEQSQHPSQAPSIPGMPPPQHFADGSTPYTRLQERINNIGRGNTPSRRNDNDAY